MRRPQQTRWSDASSDDGPDPPPKERNSGSPKKQNTRRVTTLNAWRGRAEINKARGRFYRYLSDKISARSERGDQGGEIGFCRMDRKLH